VSCEEKKEALSSIKGEAHRLEKKKGGEEYIFYILGRGNPPAFRKEKKKKRQRDINRGKKKERPSLPFISFQEKRGGGRRRSQVLKEEKIPFCKEKKKEWEETVISCEK